MKLLLSTSVLLSWALSSATAAERQEHPAGTSRIAGYQTKSTITGSKIDLDQAALERHLALGDFETAEQIYENGAHMNPYAAVKLEGPLVYSNSNDNNNNNNHHVVIGMNAHGEAIYGTIGKLDGSYTNLYVNYDEERNTPNNLPCAVGGHPEPKMDGCFAETGGLIIEGVGAVNYHYDKTNDNHFWGTLYGFSEHEADKMFHCKAHCGYPEYQKFYNYYGQLDYGDLWIRAALQGKSTNNNDEGGFTNGNEDFSKLTQKGRAVAVQTATLTLNVRTQVNRIMVEWAVERCHKNCHGGDFCPEATEPWDMAVATYAGSMVGPDGEGDGRLLFSLADELGRDFGTCGPKKNDIVGKSSVNFDIIAQFQAGRSLLEAGSCEHAELVYGKVVHLMTVPMIQGTLRSAYRLQYQRDSDGKERGRGAAYMASILPDLHACSQEDAKIVAAELSLSSGTPNFVAVKEALERNYQCLSVQCEDVGGYYDPKSGDYYPGAAPCGKRRLPANSRGGNHPQVQRIQVSGYFLGACGIMGLLAMVTVSRNRWLPALSSRADDLWSATPFFGRSQREEEEYNFHPGMMELNDSARYEPVQVPEISPNQMA